LLRGTNASNIWQANEKKQQRPANVPADCNREINRLARNRESGAAIKLRQPARNPASQIAGTSVRPIALAFHFNNRLFETTPLLSNWT